MKNVDKWKTPNFAISLFILLFMLSLPAFSTEIRYEDFTSEEIESMKTVQAVIQTRFGNIVLKFFPDVAPNHVNNFIELSKSGFYDGATFHRVIPDFMIQGGCPNSKTADRETHGTGGPGYALKAEFNDREHKRGVLSMARSKDPDSAGSQFFICVADSPHLDGQYTVFGEVIEGMAVADEIVAQKRDAKDNPLERVEMEVMIEKTGANPGDETTTGDSGGGGCFIKSLNNQIFR